MHKGYHAYFAIEDLEGDIPWKEKHFNFQYIMDRFEAVPSGCVNIVGG